RLLVGVGFVRARCGTGYAVKVVRNYPVVAPLPRPAIRQVTDTTVADNDPRPRPGTRALDAIHRRPGRALPVHPSVLNGRDGGPRRHIMRGRRSEPAHPIRVGAKNLSTIRHVSGGVAQRGDTGVVERPPVAVLIAVTAAAVQGR